MKIAHLEKDEKKWFSSLTNSKRREDFKGKNYGLSKNSQKIPKNINNRQEAQEKN